MSANVEAVELLRDDDHAGILLRAAEHEQVAAALHRTAINDGLTDDDGALLWAEKKAKAFRAVAAALSRPSPAPSDQSEVQHLMHVIDRDRYVVAHCVGAIRDAIRSRTWLLEGRGPYEWDDDDYRSEFGHAITAIEQASAPLAIVGWDKSDCTRVEERVNAARLAARDLLAKPIGPREMVGADIFGDPRDAEIERLKAALRASQPDREAIARIVELAIMRHGIAETDLEGTLYDADAILALAKEDGA